MNFPDDTSSDSDCSRSSQVSGHGTRLLSHIAHFFNQYIIMTSTFFYPEDGVSGFFRNVCNVLAGYVTCQKMIIFIVSAVKPPKFTVISWKKRQCVLPKRRLIIYQTTRRHTIEDSNLNKHRSKNLKSYSPNLKMEAAGLPTHRGWRMKIRMVGRTAKILAGIWV